MKSGRDRISELPDAIICQILSNFPTKHAVATTILSKRWKDQWTNCFNLDFSDSEFLRFNPSLNEDDDPTKVRYVNVKDVITLNKSHCIKKFRLQSETMYQSDAAACLDLIVKRNVEEIEIIINDSMYQKSPVILPQCLFTCQTLVSLKIGSDDMCPHCYIDIPPSVHLPSLKVFHCNLFNPSDAVTTKLFCDLPVLEELSCRICYINNEGILNIFIPSLKRLKLKLDEVYNYQIVVRAPRLKELDICDDMIANYVFKELPLDVKASLEFGIGMCFSYYADEYVAARTIQLMNGISSVKDSVKSLTLSTCILWALDLGNVPVFPNVTCLDVYVASCRGFTSLPNLIDRFPNLEFLVLDMEPSNRELELLGPEPQCLLLHLKRIEVWGFKGQDNELKLLGCLLKVAQVLDDVVIYTRSIALEESKSLCQKLSLLPRGSKYCQFKVLEVIFKD